MCASASQIDGYVTNTTKLPLGITYHLYFKLVKNTLTLTTGNNKSAFICLSIADHTTAEHFR